MDRFDVVRDAALRLLRGKRCWLLQFEGEADAEEQVAAAQEVVLEMENVDGAHI